MMHNFINSVGPYLANLKGTGTNFLVPTGGGGSPGGGGRIRREEIVGFFFFKKNFSFCHQHWTAIGLLQRHVGKGWVAVNCANR